VRRRPWRFGWRLVVLGGVVPVRTGLSARRSASRSRRFDGRPHSLESARRRSSRRRSTGGERRPPRLRAHAAADRTTPIPDQKLRGALRTLASNPPTSRWPSYSTTPVVTAMVVGPRTTDSSAVADAHSRYPSPTRHSENSTTSGRAQEERPAKHRRAFWAADARNPSAPASRASRVTSIPCGRSDRLPCLGPLTEAMTAHRGGHHTIELPMSPEGTARPAQGHTPCYSHEISCKVVRYHQE
jgi:hypothetical protein